MTTNVIEIKRSSADIQAEIDAVKQQRAEAATRRQEALRSKDADGATYSQVMTLKVDVERYDEQLAQLQDEHFEAFAAETMVAYAGVLDEREQAIQHARKLRLDLDEWDKGIEAERLRRRIELERARRQPTVFASRAHAFIEEAVQRSGYGARLVEALDPYRKGIDEAYKFRRHVEGLYL